MATVVEQETFLQVKNRVQSKLAAAIDADDASITVTAGEGGDFPDLYPFHLTIDDEIVSVTNRVGDAMTIVRAQQGTTAAAHANKAKVFLNITAKSVSDLNAAVNTIQQALEEGINNLIVNGTADYLITLYGGTVNAGGADIRLSKGAKIDNTVDGTLKLMTTASGYVSISEGQTIIKGDYLDLDLDGALRFIGSGLNVDGVITFRDNLNLGRSGAPITIQIYGGTIDLRGTLYVETTFRIGDSYPFSDSSGVLTLQNIDALDATTEATIEAAIDTLANLTSVQGHTITLTGDFVRSGAHSLTLTTTATTSLTLPTTGTLATQTYADSAVSTHAALTATHGVSGAIVGTSDAQALTGKTGYNGLVITADTGAITTGSWTATVITPVYGGTGVANNVASTITISGAYALTLTLSNTTALTLPTSGTVATLAGTEELDNKTLDSSVAKGTWTASGTWTVPSFTLGGIISGFGPSYYIDAGSSYLKVLTTATYGFLLENTNADHGPNIKLSHNHTTPVATNHLGNIYFQGYDGAGTPETQNFCAINITYVNVTDGNEEVSFNMHLWTAGADNLAMTVSGAGQVAGDLAYAEFDEHNDVALLHNGLREVALSLTQNPLLEALGVVIRKDTGSGWMLNFQPMMYLLAGGIYQTRQMLEDTREELLTRLADVEARLARAGLN